MAITSKIVLVSTDEYTIVSVGDFELFDFLDDFFVERGFECSHVQIEGSGDHQVHSFYFSRDYELSMLNAAISEIPLEEIERILALAAKGT